MDSEFGGIGVQVMIENHQLTVLSPVVGSPAYKAQLTAGDIITHIDGTATKGLTLAKSVQLIKGKLGTKVEIKVRRPESDTADTVSIARARVRIHTVRGGKRKDGDLWDFMYDHERQIGYVRITSFSKYNVRIGVLLRATDLSSHYRTRRRLGSKGNVSQRICCRRNRSQTTIWKTGNLFWRWNISRRKSAKSVPGKS